MRNRIFAVLVLAILAGGGLAYGTYNVINNNQPVKAQAFPTQAVVVAKGDLALDVGSAGVSVSDRGGVVERQEHPGHDHQEEQRQAGAAKGMQPGDSPGVIASLKLAVVSDL